MTEVPQLPESQISLGIACQQVAEGLNAPDLDTGGLLQHLAHEPGTELATGSKVEAGVVESSQAPPDGISQALDFRIRQRPVRPEHSHTTLRRAARKERKQCPTRKRHTALCDHRTEPVESHYNTDMIRPGARRIGDSSKGRVRNTREYHITLSKHPFELPQLKDRNWRTSV